MVILLSVLPQKNLYLTREPKIFMGNEVETRLRNTTQEYGIIKLGPAGPDFFTENFVLTGAEILAYNT